MNSHIREMSVTYGSRSDRGNEESEGENERGEDEREHDER